MKIIMTLNVIGISFVLYGFVTLQIIAGELFDHAPPIDDIDELINIAASRPGMEYLKDAELLKRIDFNPRIHPDIILDSFLTTSGLIERRGYPAETHRVQTSDGYILQMHRIPGSPQSPPRHGKRVVFLMHGLLDSSATWVLMGPNQGLGYLLADLGYDVWMGNARGNTYGRNHTTHDPDGWRGNRRRFWTFSWHEIGIIDIPEMIDFVTQQTGQQRMHYIGHSQGTTAFFVMCAERPQYNSRILSMNALAPVAFMSNLRSPFVRAAALALNSIDMATSVFGMYEFMPNSEILGLFGQAACRDEAWFQAVCSNIIFLIAGYNSAQMNYTMLPVITGHAPAGASTDQLVHYGQGIRSGRFRQFDHGMVSNMLTYGQARPPTYNLRNVRAPVALHYSNNDWLAEPVDVLKLKRELGNVIGGFMVSDKHFNHLDFTWAIDARTLVYRKVLEIMKQFEDRTQSVNDDDDDDIQSESNESNNSNEVFNGSNDSEDSVEANISIEIDFNVETEQNDIKDSE